MGFNTYPSNPFPPSTDRMDADALETEVSELKKGLTNKQDKTDNTLTTTAKTVIGAINELDSDLSTISQTVSGLSDIKVLKLSTRDNAQTKHVKMNGRGAGLLIVEQNQRDSSVYAVTVSATGTATFTKLAGYALAIDSTTSSDVTIDLNSWSLLLILSTTNSWEEITS